MQSSTNKALLSFFAALLTLWLIYTVRSALVHFLIAAIISYLLNPLVNKLCSKYKISRIFSTSLILITFISAITAVSIILLPIIFNQLSQLILILPHYAETITSTFYPKIIALLEKFNIGIEASFNELIYQNNDSSHIFDISKNTVSSIISSSLGLLNVLSLIFITPILIFYFIKDWHLISTNVTKLLPEKLSKHLHSLSIEINKTLLGYVRGQANVCLILAIFYSISFTVIGLNFGFLIGFAMGILTFIPYLGAIIAIITAVTVAIFQWGFDATYIAIILTIFAVGQLTESNFLVPKLIGSKIGLHPLWIIFGLFASGSLFGIVGILLAVPLTAICGSITKFIFNNLHDK